MATIAVVTMANVPHATMFCRRVFFSCPINATSFASRKTKKRMTGRSNPFST
jgi:hypothetical protein